MFCIAGFIALLVIFIAPAVIAIIAPGFDRERRSLAAFLLFMVAPYFVLVGLVAVIAAALNAEGRVAAVAISTILFNLAMIVALAMLPHGAVEQFYATAWLAFAISVAGFAQLALTMTVWLWSGKRWQRASRTLCRPDRDILQTRFAGFDRGWHTATETDRDNRHCVRVSGGGVVALLRKQAL